MNERRFVVNPAWPLLATMLAGTWLGWTWFALNAIGLQSDRKAAQLRLLGIGVAVACAMAIALQVSLDRGLLSSRAFEYLAIGLVAWKLWIAYRMSDDQRLDHQLYEWCGGKTINGSPVLVAGFMMRATLFSLLPPGWWNLVLR